MIKNLLTSEDIIFLNPTYWYHELPKLSLNGPDFYGIKDKIMLMDTKKEKKLVNNKGEEVFKDAKFSFMVGAKYFCLQLDSITYRIIDNDGNIVIDKFICHHPVFNKISNFEALIGKNYNIAITQEAVFKVKGKLIIGFSNGYSIFYDENEEIYGLYDEQGTRNYKNKDLSKVKSYYEAFSPSKGPSFLFLSQNLLENYIIKLLEAKYQLLKEYKYNSLYDIAVILNNNNINIAIDLTKMDILDENLKPVYRINQNGESIWIYDLEENKENVKKRVRE